MDEGVGKSRFSRRTGDTGHELLWVTGKTYIMESSLCVLKGLVGMLDISNNGIVETSIKTASSILNYDNSRKC